MTTKAWSNLPNAKHIDWALKTLEKDSEMWEVALDAVSDAMLNVACNAVWAAGWDAAEDAAAQNSSLSFLKSDSWRAARRATWDAVCGDEWRPVWGAVAALIAWGISGELLDKSVEEVTELAKAGDYDAILMLPAVIVKNKLKDKNT